MENGIMHYKLKINFGEKDNKFTLLPRKFFLTILIFLIIAFIKNKL